MKHKLNSDLVALLIIGFMMCSKSEGQRKFHISSTCGDDSRTPLEAQNKATPWRSLNRLNTFFENLSPGDSILFKRGDVFYGSLIAGQSGTPETPVVIGAYGKGAKPVITGFSTINDWILVDNNIYEALIPHNRTTVNCVVINGALQPIGRYPKITDPGGGYLNFESHSEDSSIIDRQLKGVPDWTGAEIVIRKNHWILDRTTIISHKDSVLIFIPVTTFYKLINGSGYFIQNHPSSLTHNGEWCYNAKTGKMRIWSKSAPANVKVSTIDTLLKINSKSNLRFTGISFKGANAAAICATDAGSIHIDNCIITYSGVAAVSFNRISGNFHFNDNVVSHSLNNAVNISSRARDSFCTFRNNIIDSTGMIPGMGGKGDGNYMGVLINSESGALIEYNTITNTGYVPLNFNGNNILIKNNIIDNYLKVKQDGAGIYTWNGGNPVRMKFNRVIKGNIVSNGIGNAFGTIEGVPRANGIYMDNNVNNVDIIENTVYNISGWGNHNNSPSDITIKGNTFFNIGNCCDLVRWVDDGSRPENGGQDIAGMNIQDNIFFTISPSCGAFRYADRGLNFPDPSTIKERISSMGVIDNNYFHLLNETGFGYSYQDGKSYFTSPPMSFTSWRLLTGYEKNGKIISPIPAYHINKIVTENLFPAGEFTRDIAGVKSNEGGGKFDVAWDNTSKIKDSGSLKIIVKEQLTPREFILLSASLGPVSSSKNYVIRFSTLSTAGDGIIRANLRNTDYPSKNLPASQFKPFVNSINNHEFLIKAPASDQNASWEIGINQGPGTTYIDNIEIYEADISDIGINDHVRFEVNKTKEIKVIEVDGEYVDAYGVKYSGKIILQPFTSKILIRKQTDSTHLTKNQTHVK